MTEISEVGKVAALSAQGAGAVQPSSGTSFAELFNNVATGRTELDDIFQRAAEKYNLPVNLLKAIGKIESGFNADAVSYAGAMGIMQLMPQTANYLGVTDAFDPEQNIMGGAKLLAEHLEQYDGNMELAIAAYNCGVGTVAKYGGTVPPFTINYLKKLQEVLGGDLSTPETISRVSPSSSRAYSEEGVMEPLSYIVERDGANSAAKSMELIYMAKYLELMMDSGDDKNKDEKIPL